MIQWTIPYDALFDRFLRPSQASIGVLAQVKAVDRVLDVGYGAERLAIAAKERTIALSPSIRGAQT